MMDDDPVERGIADDANTGELAATVEELRAQVDRYKAEADRNWQQFLHAAADLENYKKQAARQQRDAVQRARNALLAAVLEVVDNLERALEQWTPRDDSDALLEGIRMTHRQILDLLSNLGVRPMDVIDQPFDPRLHEAVDVASSAELGVAPGTIVGEVRRGYALHGELLRPARVKVAK